MERIHHNLIPENIQASSFIPLNPSIQPKTQCNHCCFHHNYASMPSGTAHHSAMAPCNINMCSRTCLSSLPNHFIPHAPLTCSCHSRAPMHPHSTSPLPLLVQGSTACSCCHRQRSSASISEHHHHISQIHLTTDNITYPTPHYATAYAPLPGLHHSWEPTTGYREAEYHVHVDSPSGPSIPEYYSHIHHHVNHNTNSGAPCSSRNHSIRDQALYTFASRHYRRHSSRLSSYPYPSLLHYPVGYNYTPFPSVRHIIPGSYLLPPRHLIPTSFDIIGELEAEPLENEWQEVNGQHAEPKGLCKDQIQKLPSYLVTKKTMEEFTENERCVICMCEFDVEESLRILTCAHEFHCQCVDKWLQTNPTCPICRAVVEVT